jgi:phenylacetate-CoA ligase
MRRSFAKSVLRELAAFVPLKLRMGRGYWVMRNFLDTAQHWSPQQIDTWQLSALKQIVSYAYEHTDGYRQLYDEAGVHPDELRRTGDIRFFPTVGKPLLQANLKAFTVPAVRAEYCATGGSSGTPFGFYQTAYMRRVVEQAFMHTGWAWTGWKLGMKSAVLRGSFVGTKRRFFSYDRLNRELHLSTYHLVESSARTYLDVLNAYRCDVVHAYPSQFYMFCDLVGEQVGTSLPMSGAYAFLGSENVYEWQVARCQEVFPNLRIFSWYGHTEKAILAPWCETSHQYHVWPFYGLGEVLDPDGEPVGIANEGEIVGTSFHNRATPFIRYRTEDRAVRGADRCDHCGRHFALLDTVIGRGHEVVISKAGRYISMTAIAGSIHGEMFDAITQFQFQQVEPGRVTFLFVPRRNASPNEVELQRDLARILGADVDLVVRSVPAITRTKAGKASYLDQRLQVRYGSDNLPG